jgi:carbonic anhydrase
VLTRREFLKLGLVAPAVLAACGDDSDPSLPTTRPQTADEALAASLAGNQRYVDSHTSSAAGQSGQRREGLAEGQSPWAIVWGCIDSRVPPELVFDEGLGDLFVIRTAGQVADDASLGSIEFAVDEFDVPLVLILGHERCGAVTAALEVIEGHAVAHDHVAALVDAIRPAIEQTDDKPGDHLHNAVRANVELQVQALRQERSLRERTETGRLKVVGAIYELDSGRVEVLPI